MSSINNEQPIIWLVDENLDELRTYHKTLKKLMPTSVEVRDISAYPLLDDYLPILEEPRTACIITDQKLKVTGIATYTGIELAKFLRKINSKIPIYILTNFPDDEEFIGGEWSVEDIIKKSELNDEDERLILVARIQRHINVYEDIRGEREERFNYLLNKSLNSDLDNSELQELEALGLQRTAPNLTRELTQIKQMGEVVRAHEELMEQLKHYSHMEKDDAV